MARKTFAPPSSKEAVTRTDAEELLESLLLELARTNLRDTEVLLRGLAEALQIVSTALPPSTSPPRDVWSEPQRDGYRSRKTWERWILRQKYPRLRDHQ